MKVIPPLPIGTFSRASKATYFDATGTLQTADVDQPRTTYDPATLVFQGVLLEGATTNLIARSEEFDDAAWTKAGVTVTANALTGPDGMTSMDALIPTVGAGFKSVEATFAAVAGNRYTISVFATTFAWPEFSLEASNAWAAQGVGSGGQFNLFGGSINAAYGGQAVGNLSIQHFGLFSRVSVTWDCIATMSATVKLLISNRADQLAPTGDGTSAVYVWGAQCEPGSAVTSYIATTAAPATRAADIQSGPYFDSNVAENDYAVWASGTTYALAARVIEPSTHTVYESVQAGNMGNDPTLATSTTPTDWWIVVGPTNRWAMFDLIRNTATSQPLSLTAVVTPGERVNSLALMGVVANSASITVTSGGVTQYTHTENLNERSVDGWYDYFFAAFGTRPTVIVFDLPPFTNAVVTVTLTATSGNVECGACVLGNFVDIGTVVAEAESDVLNFSTVDRDFAGGISTMVQRRNVPKTIQTIWFPKSDTNKIRALRDSLNGTPAVWAGIDDSTDDYFEAILILGFYRRFTIDLTLPENGKISLELEQV
jgi:hypothetical protein